MKDIDLRTVNVVQYLKPLREGGSLPAIVRADDDFPYVLKFRGAGQGKKALVAELIGGELARGLGLQVPEIVLMQLDDSFGRAEPDEEIQDLLKFSVGLNLGLHYLAGAITYDPLVSRVDGLTASLAVLLDSIITNIDRTAKNTNLLIWNRELWLIDHGASLYFHHNWANWQSSLGKNFPQVKDHVLLERADFLPEAAAKIRSVFDRAFLGKVVAAIPDDWLIEESDDLSPDDKRAAYTEFLLDKLSRLGILLKDAEDAR